MNSFTLILIICFGCVCSSVQDICRSQITCRDCIQQAECLWCITQNISSTHCLPKNEEAKCESNQMENPKSEMIITKNDPLSLISPTEINLKIRSQNMQKISFTFTQPTDFPIDLYFLMDVSYTMKPHKKSLLSLASEIVNLLKKYSSDLKMGFGSFVDKPVSPFAFTKNGNLINPCSKIKEDCNLPYIFQNHLSLTNDTIRFSHEVNTTKLSGNIDVPEGSLEALMQAIVCKKEIGWRENARRLIILSTDNIFHIAGDGKFAGIDKPNDGLCHLDNNIYTHSLEQDYPSIGQIAEKINSNNVIVIFAITEPVKKVYEQLTHRVPSSFIGILSEHSTIWNILQNISENIANTVKIKHNFGNEFNIDFTSKCEKYDRVNVTCPLVKPGDTISFTAKLELIKCPENNTKANYKIYPSGLNSHLSINVEYLCDCPCEKTGQKLSESCNGIGEFQCGVCKCPSDKIGISCECNKNSKSKSSALWDEQNCIKDNSTEICSGAGICNCGQCICDEKSGKRDQIYGPYCECNDNSCYDENDEMCSHHGECKCGICLCNQGWHGRKCECSENTDTCVESNSDEICSRRGNCICGKCNCYSINGHSFMGEYCETCLTCPRCSHYRNCVECKMFKQGLYDENQCEENCINFTFSPVENIDKIEKGESCSFRDEKDCIFKYKYVFDVEKNTTTLYVQQEKQECFEAANITFWAGIPILSILAAVLIGLLIWKLVDIHQYKQEYAKFQQDCTLEHKELSPLYISPTTQVQNPLYGAVEKDL